MFDATRARLLEAMGYQVLVRADAAAAAPAQAAAEASATRSAAPVDPAPVHRAAPVIASTDRLWNALLVAGAMDPLRAEANGLRLTSNGVAVEYVRDELWIDPQALRRDPGAKRALWKALRSLRRAELARRR